MLADLVDADAHLPHIAPGVIFEGDDIGTRRWRQQLAQPLPEQRKRLTKLGIQGATASSAAPLRRVQPGPCEGREQGPGCFQRGLATLTQ